MGFFFHPWEKRLSRCRSEILRKHRLPRRAKEAREQRNRRKRSHFHPQLQVLLDPGYQKRLLRTRLPQKPFDPVQTQRPLEQPQDEQGRIQRRNHWFGSLRRRILRTTQLNRWENGSLLRIHEVEKSVPTNRWKILKGILFLRVKTTRFPGSTQWQRLPTLGRLQNPRPYWAKDHPPAGPWCRTHFQKLILETSLELVVLFPILRRRNPNPPTVP